MMKKVFVALNFILLFYFALRAQEMSASLLATDARFEIVQSPWDRSTTFRLDRFRGAIDRLATCPKDDAVGSNRCWKEMLVIDGGRSRSSRAHFQIVFLIAAKSIFLMDNDTGQAWQYALDASEKWHPFVECQDKASPTCLWRPLP